jgi:hypothetical protein
MITSTGKTKRLVGCGANAKIANANELKKRVNERKQTRKNMRKDYENSATTTNGRNQKDLQLEMHGEGRTAIEFNSTLIEERKSGTQKTPFSSGRTQQDAPSDER